MAAHYNQGPGGRCRGGERRAHAVLPGPPGVARTSSGRSLLATKPAARASSTRLTSLSHPGFPAPSPPAPPPRPLRRTGTRACPSLGLQVGVGLLLLLLPPALGGLSASKYFVCG